MIKITAITEEERQLFRDAMSQIKPLAKTPSIDTHSPVKKPIVIKPRATASHDDRPRYSFDRQQKAVEGDTIIAYKKSGVTHKRVQLLRQGKIHIEATLDLHEHNSDAALQATDHFLQRCHRNHFRTVCIIHGKGMSMGDHKPVLKNLLNNYLRQHPRVLAFHSAHRTRGGTGAITVLLKS